MSSTDIEVVILIPGYVTASSPGKIRASCTMTLIKGPEPVLVDTGVPSQNSEIVAKLAEHHLAPGDIRHVILTHGHSDHVGNNSLFPQATFLMDTDVSVGDEYWLHDFSQGPYHIGDRIRVIATPGHTDHDLSVLVETPLGVVAIAGDVFEYDGDWLDRAWEAWSKNPDRQRQSRELLVREAQFIVPGHGSMFDSPKWETLGNP
ncbi:MAG TPA: MBL fold metallo-hydrolase [Candidatus Limnocylindria bacterium]|jgi:glyoxylase-like metal-dependent hydrolase (beta-lactamase superfamily II)|nr:MBL fold metallo-hydrolase [Candidatus Limnocylindria bacterium]